MRRLLVVIHRWLGLCTALFLTLAGLTGALMAWDHELDTWLNPELFTAPSVPANARSPLQLVEAFEKEHPQLRVRFAPLEVRPGESLFVWLTPRRDPTTNKPYPASYDQVAIDPSTGRVLGKRLWGEFALSRRTLMPFIYRLHYSLHLPETLGVHPGDLLMGIVAMAWTIDAFIALWISFPNLSTWRKSFSFRVKAGGYRLLFDVHRSGGVWLWPVLLVLAVTGVSMNLRDEVVKPLVRVFSPLTPSPFDAGEDGVRTQPAQRTREQIVARARAEARARAIQMPPGGISYVESLGLYGVGFFEPGGERAEGGLGNPWLYFDARDGRLLTADIPGRGTAGDVFMQLQFPLHSGRILGVWGRAIISFLGLMIAALSVTGIVIWARKRRARVSKKPDTQRA